MNDEYVSFICSFIMNIGCFGLLMTSTWWVMKKLKPLMIVPEIDMNDDHNMNSILLKSIKSKSMERAQFKNILNNEKYFAVFMIHLSKEFSMHFLIAFIEIIQMQQYIFNKIRFVNDEEQQEYFFQDINFYETVPKSSIVYANGCNDDEERNNNNSLEIIKIKSVKLYDKYIEYGSEYEVIITKLTRNKITDVMSHKDWIDDDEVDSNVILQLWDEVSEDLFTLLLNSFNRFRFKVQYRNLDLPLTY